MAKIAHAAPHRPIHAAPHAAQAKPAASKPHGHGGVIALAIAGLAVATLGMWALVNPAPPKLDPAETLLEQMHAAATGNVVATHAFGGNLAVTYGTGRMNVTAEALPGKACVQVGWHLAKEGTIIVNGILPMRLSAAKLSELCSDREGGATLTWAPDDK